MDYKIEQLKKRAQYFTQIRNFFDERDIWEVDTPIMSRYGNPDPALLNFKSIFHGPGELYKKPVYLITSPEYHMKRLLAMGSGSIYYLGKVFRDGELSNRHNPEFTILEWYHVNYTLMQLVDELIALIRNLAGKLIPVQQIEYRDLFLEHLSLDPFSNTQVDLLACIKQSGIDLTFTPTTQDECLDILMTHVIEPRLQKDCIVVISHYPASQASLAKIEEKPYGLVGKRFELYWQGFELANGYEELTDSREQEARFRKENEIRLLYGLEKVAIDRFLLARMDQMPALCSGVAVGIDRVLMAVESLTDIKTVIAFAFEES